MDPNTTLEIIRSYSQSWSGPFQSTLDGHLTRMMTKESCAHAANEAIMLVRFMPESDDRDEAIEAIKDLRDWILRGGFIPTW